MRRGTLRQMCACMVSLAVASALVAAVRAQAPVVLKRSAPLPAPAQCNDGSPSYTYRTHTHEGRAASGATWLVWLQGGFACSDPASCTERAKDFPDVRARLWL